MCFKGCNCVISATASILIGAVIGILFFSALIPAITTAVIIALIFAALTLLLLTIIGVSREEKECVCKVGKCVLLGASLTLVLGLISSVLTLATGAIGYAILVGLLGAAFFFTLFGVIELIGCLLKCKYDCCK